MPRNRKPAGDLLEDRPFYKNVKAMIALAVALAGGAVSVRTYFAPKPPEVVHDSTELIIDRSKRMGETWENTTRIKAAVNAAEEILGTISAGENLALRELGGSCKSTTTSLDVPFAENNVKRVRGRVDALRPDGEANIYEAVNEAIGDFGRQKYFEGSNRRILVITGSADDCRNAFLTDAIRGKLEEHAKSYNIRLDIQYLGVGLDDAQKESLRALARVTGGTPAFADHPEDVDRLVQEVMRSPGPGATPSPAPAGAGNQSPGEEAKAPIRQDTASLVDSLKAGVKDLDDALKDVASGDLASAEAALTAAQQAGDRSDTALSKLGEAQGQEMQDLFKAATKCRTIHRRLLAKARVVVTQFQAKDKDGYKASSAEYDRLVDEFDRTAKRINALLAHP